MKKISTLFLAFTLSVSAFANGPTGGSCSPDSMRTFLLERTYFNQTAPQDAVL